MNRWLISIGLLGLLSLFSSCLTAPVERSGGPGSITIQNTNAFAIAAAARSVFPFHGYVPGPSNLPESISFQRMAGRTGEAVFGSFNSRTSFRVQLRLIPIPGTPDFRVTTQVSRINNAGRPGFERETGMMRSWSAQFGPILREIRSLAENAGTR